MKGNFLKIFFLVIFLLCGSLLIYNLIESYNSTREQLDLIHEKYENLLIDNIVLEQQELLEQNLKNITEKYDIDNISVLDSKLNSKSLFITSKKTHNHILIEYTFFKKFLKRCIPLTIFLILSSLIFYFALGIQRKVSKDLVEAKVTKAKSEIADLVYHDIKSPLMLIKNSLDNARNNRVEVLKSINQILSVLDDLNSYDCDFTNIKELCNFSVLIEEIINLKKQEYLDLNIVAINLDLTRFNKDFKVCIDKSSMTRTISNIINNSIEAKSSKIDISLFIKEDNLFITVTDDGNGLKTNNPFKKNISSKSQSGFGLYQARKFISGLSGEISFTKINQPKTTTLKISIPVKSIEHQLEEIVLVDDSQIVRNNWMLNARKSNTKIHVFKNISHFLKQTKNIKKTSTLFLDFNYKDEVLSMEQLEKIYKKGFKKIIINSDSQRARKEYGNRYSFSTSKNYI